MTFDPSALRPDQARILRDGPVSYENSDLPRIAIAQPGCQHSTAAMWVRSHGDPMMFRDADNNWVLVHYGPNNAVTGTKQPFTGLTDVHKAATRMREWLDDQGLIMEEDLES